MKSEERGTKIKNANETYNLSEYDDSSLTQNIFRASKSNELNDLEDMVFRKKSTINEFDIISFKNVLIPIYK